MEFPPINLNCRLVLIELEQLIQTNQARKTWLDLLPGLLVYWLVCLFQ